MCKMWNLGSKIFSEKGESRPPPPDNQRVIPGLVIFANKQTIIIGTNW